MSKKYSLMVRSRRQAASRTTRDGRKAVRTTRVPYVKAALYTPAMSAWVYILRCRDASYYVGSTRGGLEDRIAQHNDGTFGGYTASRRPVALVYAQEFDRITDAFAAEQQVKRWSRAKKEALIAGDFDLLRDLAKRRTRHD